MPDNVKTIPSDKLQLLDFEVGGHCYGININKVVEIMMRRQLAPIPNSPEEIEGVFMPRGELITVVDLHKVLNLEEDKNERGLFIICQFNGMETAFHVDKVNGIHTTAWSNIEHPPKMAVHSEDTIATGIVKSDGRVIIILDFERIIAELNEGKPLDLSGVEALQNLSVGYSEKHIVIVEDSDFLNRMIVGSFSDIGFKNISSFNNGKDAWEHLSKLKDGGDVSNQVAAIVTDIEMPQMDGLRLTALIKSDEQLKAIPVFIFSSMLNDNMREKAKAVGADGQFSKPQLGTLMQELVKILN